MATETREFILLLEDLGHLENGDHLAGLEFERAEAVIDELARLHAWAWNLDAAPMSATDRTAVSSSSSAEQRLGGLTVGRPRLPRLSQCRSLEVAQPV